DLDLAAVEADLSPRSAPTVRPPRRVATVARPAGCRDIRLHHRAERLDPCRKAEPIEARPHFCKRFVHSPGRRRTSRCDISRHGVALLCGITTPSLPAQGGQRRPLQKIQQNPGHPRSLTSRGFWGVIPPRGRPSGFESLERNRLSPHDPNLRYLIQSFA